ncbi:MAG: ParB/RepB/Spo0J family partition protein [Gammaproteobacteria bacterium]|nr:ParB/RepB/Spo0J family partition protein [Gammaproteobacteria bacterium]
MSSNSRGLNRGLQDLGINELLSDIAVERKTELRKLPLDVLQPGKYQPRKDMDSEALEELANSIRSQGIIQPIVVRKVASGHYEIIAGERRWRAAQIAELDEIPAVVRDIPDEAAIAMSLIENIQRENLNVMEEAVALQRLLEEFGLTHQQVADSVGKSRTTVTNLLRLLGLPDAVRTMLEHGDLEMGHARAILALVAEQQLQAAKTVVAKGLSVRETEKLVRRLQNPAKAATSYSADPNILQLQNNLADKLGARIVVQHSANGSGKLVIEYNNLDELDGIIKHIN